MTVVHQLNTNEDELVVLHQCMRPEEDLRQYRRHVPWKGEYRFFRSENVICIEHFRQPHVQHTSPWCGSYQWFASDNVLQLEQYRSHNDWVQARERLRSRGIIG
jgi:hypothetical protein